MHDTSFCKPSLQGLVLKHKLIELRLVPSECNHAWIHNSEPIALCCILISFVDGFSLVSMVKCAHLTFKLKTVKFTPGFRTKVGPFH